jgi:hypothetical protein
MSATAFKRDLSDFKTILDFCETVQSPERLRLLLLLFRAQDRMVAATPLGDVVEQHRDIEDAPRHDLVDGRVSSVASCPISAVSWRRCSSTCTTTTPSTSIPSGSNGRRHAPWRCRGAAPRHRGRAATRSGR